MHLLEKGNKFTSKIIFRIIMGGRAGLRKVKCRVRAREVNYQYYSDHLQSMHPREDSSNLRTLNQHSFSFFSKRKLSESGDTNISDIVVTTSTTPTVAATESENNVPVNPNVEKLDNVIKDEPMSIEEESEHMNVDDDKETVEVEAVNEVLLQMLGKVEANVDFSDCRTKTEKLNN